MNSHRLFNSLIFLLLLFLCQSKDLQLDIIPATAPGSEVKLRDAAHELNEEKRKSARRKEYVPTSCHFLIRKCSRLYLIKLYSV